MPIPGLGWQNPLPAQIGGGPTDGELIHEGLRKSVDPDAVGPYGGIEDLWRQCKATAIAAAHGVFERAALQAVPGLATDKLATYERVLYLPGADTDAERREEVAAAWSRVPAADIPSIRLELARISPQLDVVLLDPSLYVVVQFGKQLAPRVGGPPFGSGAMAGKRSALFPNYSTAFVVFVRYTLAAGETMIPLLVRDNVRRYLNETLSAWDSWELSANAPFYLDGGPDGTSLLDQTAFG